MAIKNVGVVGGGLMGRGIAEVSILNGFNVVLSDISKELVDKALVAIDSSMEKSIKGGKLTSEKKAAVLKCLKTTTNTSEFKECDLVIEAIHENLELKKKIIADLDKICPPDTILATNTSCLSVMDIAAATKRQPMVLGMHFFNPVPMMKLMELVKTIATGEETIKTARAFGEAIGKEVVIAPDAPGFIVNRLLWPFLLEAIKMLESGMATKEDIDKAVKLGLNHPMGPLALADFVGLDTTYYICNAMYDDLKDAHFASPVLLKKMVSAGQLGRKSGKGFYDYK